MADEVDPWLFTEAELLQTREHVHRCVVEAFRKLEGAKEPSAPPSPQELAPLVSFYAQKIPELGGLCKASTDVQWTALVFYRRFFALRSPLEFDPLVIMFTSLHVACKVEEERHITLDALLDAADFDASMNVKVADHEVTLLEGVGFNLLVEPKPSAALRMLAEDLRRYIDHVVFIPSGALDFNGAAMLSLSEAEWSGVYAATEKAILKLCTRSDAVLLWPSSVIIAAALLSVLKATSGRALQLADHLDRLLNAKLETAAERAEFKSMIHAVTGVLRRIPAEVGDSALAQVGRGARRCYRTFERLRRQALEVAEGQRQELKRQRREAKRSGSVQ